MNIARTLPLARAFSRNVNTKRYFSTSPYNDLERQVAELRKKLFVTKLMLCIPLGGTIGIIYGHLMHRK